MPQILDFITPTVLLVLDHFFAHPAEEFHEREIIRATGVSKGSANRILRKLAKLAILQRTEKGRMVFYRLSASDPFVKQMKAAENVWTLRPLTESLKTSSHKVILFGSCAEGSDLASSDIDLLIITGEKAASISRISSFNQAAPRRISPIILSMDEFIRMRREDPPLYERIDRGIVLWETA